MLVGTFTWILPTQAATYYVDNTDASCSDSFTTAQNSTTQPWCTITRANSAHAAGDTVVIKKGTYRESIIPKAGVSNTQRTVYSGASTDPSQVLVLGSDAVTGWQQYSGNIYRAPFVGGNQCRDPGDGTTVVNTNCWVDRSTWLLRGALTSSGDSLSDLNAAGEFFYDANAHYVYAWMPNSDSPSNHLVECSRRNVFETGAYTPNPEVYNFTLQNITVMQTLGRGLTFGSNPHRPGNITIQNNEIAFTTGSNFCADNPAAIYHGNSDDYSPDIPNIQILNNTIHDAGSHGGPPSDDRIPNTHKGAGIEFYTVKDSLIQGNTIYNTYGPIGMKRGNSGITIQDNVVCDSWEGIWVGPPNLDGTTSTELNATVVGNVVYDLNNYGDAWGFYSSNGNTTFKLINNTFVNTTGIHISTDKASDNDYRKDNVHATVANNVVSNLKRFPYTQPGYRFLSVYWNAVANLTSHNNLYYDPTNTNFGATAVGGRDTTYTNYTSLQQWQTATSKDGQSIFSNPLFVNFTGKNFQLSATSPAVNLGSVISGVHCAQSDDVNPTQTGCRHWKGAAPDIGAHEYGLSVTTPATPGGSTPTSTPGTVSVPTTPDTAASFVVAVDGGASPAVRVITGGTFQREFFAFEKTFRGGMSLAFGDLGTDGQKEIVVGAGIGRVGEVRVFSTTGSHVATFLPYGSAFRNGVNVTLADVNGDGTKEIITAPMRGDQRVRTFGYRSGRYTQVQPEFGSGYLSTSLAAGDLNADGKAEIVVMSEAAGSPTILAYALRGTRYQRIAALQGVFSTRYRTGYSLAVGDVQGDGIQDIVVTRSSITEPEVRTFTLRGSSFRQQSVFTALGKTARGGGRIAVMDYNGDGADDILLTRNIPADPKVYIYSMVGGVRRIGTLQAYPANRRFVLVPAGK